MGDYFWQVFLDLRRPPEEGDEDEDGRLEDALSNFLARNPGLESLLSTFPVLEGWDE